MVGAVETMVAVGPGYDKSDRVEFSQLVLDRVKGETTHVHQLAHVAMLLWFREKQPQKLGSHPGEQDIKNRLFRTHCSFVNLTALSRRVFFSERRDIFVWQGGNLYKTLGTHAASPREIRGQRREIRDQRGVKNPERLKSALARVIRSAESGACRASALACRDGRQECLPYDALHVPIVD